MKHNITFWQDAIKEIRDDYGADCEDFDKNSASCQAKEVIQFIERHISFIEDENEEMGTTDPNNVKYD